MMKPTCTNLIIFSFIVFTRSEPVGKRAANWEKTRRILNGNEVGETRPYMVYLRPTALADKLLATSQWLCGGVIIHPRYIVTSAACIEDAKNFYVVAGTNVWSPNNEDNECIRNGAKKAVWKCVPKDYYFDGQEFDNIRWMSGDIAVVKVEDEFNLVKRVRGCDYIPRMLAFNNVSEDNEKPGTMGSAAGWGSIDNFGDLVVGKKTKNSVQLLETDVQIISKKNCKKRWDLRYHNIIDQSMICTKDDQDGVLMSAACIEQGVRCKELEYSDDYEDDNEERLRQRSRRVLDPDVMEVHDSTHFKNETRRFKITSGGFCENDHGGPLIVGQGTTSIVVGVISACLTREVSMKCYGPYLYTSVWQHRHLISCAIDKDVGNTERCRKAFGEEKTFKNQISEVTFDWKDKEKPVRQPTRFNKRAGPPPKRKVKETTHTTTSKSSSSSA